MLHEDLAVDPRIAPELVRVDLASDVGKGLAVERDFPGPGLGSDVVELVVEPMVAQPRRRERLGLEPGVEIGSKRGVEPGFLRSVVLLGMNDLHRTGEPEENHENDQDAHQTCSLYRDSLTSDGFW